jgi:two-component system response regulator (stage 0 sporulation protein A)
MLELGIPNKLKGYKYIRDSIILIYEEFEEEFEITKDVYPLIAKKYNTKPSNIERNMRYALEISWERGNVEKINNIFGYTISEKTFKPTNSEFISRIVEELILSKFNFKG